MSTPPTFVPRSGETWRDPYPMYRALRDHDPVHHVVDGDYWVLTRFADVLDAAIDSSTFSSAKGLTFAYGEMEALGLEAPIVMMDPPEHTALRQLVVGKFTPKRVAALEPMVRSFVRERVAWLREAGRADIVAEFFKPLPSRVVAHFLGVAAADRGLFDRWTNAIVAANAEGDVLSAGDAVGEMFGYLNRLIERRRGDPGDDMISMLVHGRSGDQPVSLAEILTRHPDQRRLLIEDPTRLRDAVEEFLRLTSPVQGLARTVTRDVEIGERTIPSGRKVMLLYASANRDEREYGEAADVCDVARRARRHLSFSYGPHHCIGAAAARLQARVALEELLAACPDFVVDPETGRFATGHFVRRYESLPFFASGAD
jgi:cytochrome P450